MARQYLQTHDEEGNEHHVPLDEYEHGLHRRSSNRYSSCVCAPRFVGGVFIHRSMTSRRQIYRPWEARGGH